MFLFYRIFPLFLFFCSFEVLQIPFLGISLLRFLAALCIIAIFFDLLYQVFKDSKKVRIRISLDLKLVILFLVNALITCWGYEADARNKIIENACMLFVLFCFVRIYAVEPDKLLKFIKYITIGFLFGSIISYLVYKNTISIPSYLIEDFRLENERKRFVGLLRNPNRYGLFAMLSMFSLIVWIRFSMKSKRNFISILIYAFMILAHLFFVRETFSRATTVAMMISLVSFFVISFLINKDIRGKTMIAFVVLVVSCLLVSIIDKTFVNRFDLASAYSSNSGLNRNILLTESLNIIRTNPILGFIGNPNVEGYYAYNVSSHDPHNAFLFNWLHHGFFGMLTVLGIILCILKQSISSIGQGNFWNTPLSPAFLIGLIAFSLMHSATYWKGCILMLAMISSMNAMHRPKQHS